MGTYGMRRNGMLAGFSVDLLLGFVLWHTDDVLMCILALNVIWNSGSGVGHGSNSMGWCMDLVMKVRFESQGNWRDRMLVGRLIYLSPTVLPVKICTISVYIIHHRT